MFVSVSHLHSSLIVVCIVKPSLNELRSQGKFVAFPAVLDLGQMWRTVTNTLAYYIIELITVIKSVIE